MDKVKITIDIGENILDLAVYGEYDQATPAEPVHGLEEGKASFIVHYVRACGKYLGVEIDDNPPYLTSAEKILYATIQDAYDVEIERKAVESFEKGWVK